MKCSIFEKPKIRIRRNLLEDKTYGRFVVEPLERGYGTTLGNSLRRIMLSSLPGAAVSQVKIDGVLHEFSSIPGVKEDVTEIIMNIKNLAIRNNSSTNEPKVAYIEFEGEGVVTAADIQVDSDIEILNPELEIAHLNGGADSKLYMELTITNGRGYVGAEKNKNEDTPIGVLAVDSIYTPVERVNLTVENTRVGQVTDYDKLTLDVFTNGTLEPDEAVSLAAKVLSEHLNLFIDLSEAAQQVDVMVEKENDAQEKVLEMNIDELELSSWFTGEFDHGDAIVTIKPGQGGLEAQDWTFMLFKMYMKYCQRRGWKVTINDCPAAEVIGIDRATFTVEGKDAFGMLRAEAGVHRLVRISPTDDKKRRHTTFAGVEVLPVLPDDIEVDLNPADVRVDVYRSSGPGGQCVNTTDSAVRLTHIPTNIVVTCQNEKSQLQNKEAAFRVLKAKLYEREEQKRQEELAELRGDRMDNTFGSQIRNYVLYPYQMVKDVRSGIETGNVDAVLDGELDEFVIGYHRWRVSQ